MARDLRLARNGREYEAERRSATFGEPWADEASTAHLMRRAGIAPAGAAQQQ